MGRISNSDYLFGLTCSFVGHVILFVIIFFKVSPTFRSFNKPVIYSVSLEGGEKLGGIHQTSKAKKKTPIVPYKKVKKKITKKVKKKPVVIKKESVKKKVVVKKKVIPKKSSPPAKVKKQPVKKSKETEIQEIDKQLQKAMQRYLGESSDVGGKGFGSARLGGTGMGGGVQRPPEFFEYKEILEKSIKQGWRWHDREGDLRCTVIFGISERGELSDVSIENTSGNREYDESVLRAIYKANPLPIPPKTVYDFFRKVRMIFVPQDLE